MSLEKPKKLNIEVNLESVNFAGNPAGDILIILSRMTSAIHDHGSLFKGNRFADKDSYGRSIYTATFN